MPKIPSLPTVAAPSALDQIPLEDVSAGTTGKITLQGVKDWMGFETGYFVNQDTYTYSSGTGTRIAVITTPTGSQARYYKGMPVSFIQTTEKQGYITDITDTSITVFLNVDYTFANAAISGFKYGLPDTIPLGFVKNPSKYQLVVASASSTTQSSPSANTWYNIASMQLTLQKGVWSVEYHTAASAQNTGATTGTVVTTLSTANNTESDDTWSRSSYVGVLSSEHILSRTAREFLTITTPTTYYLNTSASAAITNIGNRGDRAPTFIRATLVYAM